LQAGVKVPIFNAGASTTETQSFAKSTFEMLGVLMPDLRREQDLNSTNFRHNMPSTIGWVNGRLSTLSVKQVSDAEGCPL
jgi:hypothetical protein